MVFQHKMNGNYYMKHKNITVIIKDKWLKNKSRVMIGYFQHPDGLWGMLNRKTSQGLEACKVIEELNKSPKKVE